MSAPKKGTKAIQKEQKQDDSSVSSSEIVQIEQELKEINPKVFDGVPISQRREIIRTMVSFKSHSGPLPDPETMSAYNLMIPNGAERIMVMAEEQAKHRMGLEKKAIPSQLDQSKYGQIYGFVLSVLLIGSSVYLAATGHEKTACVLGGGTIIALAIIFVLKQMPRSTK